MEFYGRPYWYSFLILLCQNWEYIHVSKTTKNHCHCWLEILVKSYSFSPLKKEQSLFTCKTLREEKMLKSKVKEISCCSPLLICEMKSVMLSFFKSATNSYKLPRSIFFPREKIQKYNKRTVPCWSENRIIIIIY